MHKPTGSTEKLLSMEHASGSDRQSLRHGDGKNSVFNFKYTIRSLKRKKRFIFS